MPWASVKRSTGKVGSDVADTGVGVTLIEQKKPQHYIIADTSDTEGK